MIPYEELVVALQTWRARQGLPVTQLSGSLTPPPPPARPVAPPATRAQAKPPGPPPRTAAPPPAPPPAPPFLAPPADSLDVEDAALLDENHYENEGDNFTMKFNDREVEHDAESTNVASDLESRLTEPNLGGGRTIDETVELPDPKHSIRSTNRNDDW